MNYDGAISDLKWQREQIDRRLAEMIVRRTEAEKYTETFLECCARHGIELVSIGIRTSEIPCSRTYSFAPEGSVFTEVYKGKHHPAIWDVVEELGISGGCGNGGQHQVSCDHKLINGVYRLVDGEWRRG